MLEPSSSKGSRIYRGANKLLEPSTSTAYRIYRGAGIRLSSNSRRRIGGITSQKWLGGGLVMRLQETRSGFAWLSTVGHRKKLHQIGFQFPGWATNLIGIVAWLPRLEEVHDRTKLDGSGHGSSCRRSRLLRAFSPY